jgi:hypothetical protein
MVVLHGSHPLYFSIHKADFKFIINRFRLIDERKKYVSNTRFGFILIVINLLTVLFTSCGGEDGSVLARGDGIEVTDEDFVNEFNRLKIQSGRKAGEQGFVSGGSRKN